MVVSAADFRVPFSKSHFWLADMLGLTSGSDSDTASRNCIRRGPLVSCSVLQRACFADGGCAISLQM